MAQHEEIRTFPLRTVLVTIKAAELGRRGVEYTGVRLKNTLEIVRFARPDFRVPTEPEDAETWIRYRFARELGKQFPRLAAVSVDKVSQDNVEDWLRTMEVEFGETVEVRRAMDGHDA